MIDVGYQLTKDIDWFCSINGYPIHVASNGGRLPNFIRSNRQLFEMNHLALSMPDIFEYEVNREIRLNPNEDLESLGDSFYQYFPETTDILGDIQFNNTHRAYYWSFVAMAKKGFYSFDKIELGEHDSHYRLVAWPKCPCRFKEGNCDICCGKEYLNFLGNWRNAFDIPQIDMSNIHSLYCIDLVDKINEAYQIQKDKRY